MAITTHQNLSVGNCLTRASTAQSDWFVLSLSRKVLLELNPYIARKGSVCTGSNISDKRDNVSLGYPNTEKRLGNMKRSGLF